MKRRVGLAGAFALAIGAMTALVAAPAMAASGDPIGCVSDWVVTDTSASGYCDGSNNAYKEKVKCTDGLWHYGNVTLGQGRRPNPLSTAYCPRNQFLVQTGIVKI
jgi:hypothetical protein